MVLAHRRPDQFYWVATLLSARFGEATATTVIAAVVAALAALPVAAVFTPIGPHSLVGIAASAAIASFLAVAALMWGRRRWPTRGQSLIFVVGMICAATAEPLLLTEPTIALLATMMFTVVGLYVAIFHSVTYLGFTLAAAAATASLLAARLAGHVGVLGAVSLVVLVVMITGTVPLACWVAMQLPAIDLLRRDVDVFTGLLTPTAFGRSVAELISARTRHDDQHLVLTAVVLDDLALLTAADGYVPRQRAQVAIADALRRTTRNAAILSHIDTQLFAVAELFTTTDLTSYAERVHGALTSTPPRMSVSIGIVHTPRAELTMSSPDLVVDELIAAAADQARRHQPGHTPPCIAVKLHTPRVSADYVDDGDGIGE